MSNKVYSQDFDYHKPDEFVGEQRQSFREKEPVKIKTGTPPAGHQTNFKDDTDDWLGSGSKSASPKRAAKPQIEIEGYHSPIKDNPFLMNNKK